MSKTKLPIKFLSSLFLVQLFFLVFRSSAVANADDLIIDYNGAVTIVPSETTVLATSTESAPTPTTAPITTPSTQKVIPIAPPNSDTKVKINPNTGDDKKIKITIETTTQTKTTTAPASTTTKPTNIKTVEKTVDNVILRGADKKPVLTIKPDEKNSSQITIQQQSAKVSTNLPIQIDAKNHGISVQTSGGEKSVLVLPDQATKGAEESVKSQLPTTESHVSLSDEKGQAAYIVNEVKTGKFLGTFNINLPSQVKISAENGKTISVQKSPFSIFIGFLIR